MRKKPVNIFWKFTPFWLFLLFFKLGGGLLYGLISPLGERLLPLWQVGLLMGGTGLVQLLLDVPTGYALDRYGYRRGLIVMVWLFVVTAIMLLFSFSIITFLIGMIAATFGWLLFGPAENAYTLSHAPKHITAKFMSARDTFGAIGAMIAGTTVAAVASMNTTVIGVILFIIFVIALGFIYLSPVDTAPLSNHNKIPTQHHYIHRTRLLSTWRAIRALNPASGTLLLLNFAAATFYGAIWFTIPLVIVHNLGSEALTIGLGIFNLAIVLLGYIIGSLADKLNKRALVFIGLIIFAISGLLLGFNFNALFLLFGFMATAGEELAGLSLWSWLYALDKEHAHDGAIAGVLSLAGDLGWTIGPIAAGILYTVVGPSWTIAYCALPIIIAWGVYSFMIHRHLPRFHWPGTLPPRPRHIHS